MALIQCPKCGKTISDKAEKCIGCGYILNPDVSGQVIDQEVVGWTANYTRGRTGI